MDQTRGVWARLRGLPTAGFNQWRTGSSRGQYVTLAALVIGLFACFAISAQRYEVMPVGTFCVWMFCGVLLLRFALLVALTLLTVAAAIGTMVIDGTWSTAGSAGLMALLVCAVIAVLVASRQSSGLPAPLSDALLADLRGRLQRQGRIPELPEPWDAQTAMLASHGVDYAGDFLVAHLHDDDQALELVLVDVCGKGLTAGPPALQFAGALGGLIGTMPAGELFLAANRFLLRQIEDERFATAVHVKLDLRTGDYQIASAGHPPALRWNGRQRRWTVDNARGMALGIVDVPDLEVSSGSLAPGEALMFYTDGVVESRAQDVEAGIAWLSRTAERVVGKGFDRAAERIIKRVAAGDDDRAVLILHRRTSVPGAEGPDPVASGQADSPLPSGEPSAPVSQPS